MTPLGHWKEWSEKEWLEQFRGLVRMLGWETYHPHQSQRSEPGFPDLVCVKRRVVFVELKRETASAKLSPHQVRWRDSLIGAGAEWWLLRPRHAELLPVIFGSGSRDPVLRGRLEECQMEGCGITGRPVP